MVTLCGGENSPPSADIELHSITLQNSPFPNIGANRGDVFILDSILLGGGNREELGGGIYAGSGSIRVDGTRIQDFQALNGGAIYAYNGSIEIADSLFLDNQAMVFGGAIWTAQGPITIHDSEFNGNIANNGSGGAVFSETSNVSLVNVVFRGNTAQLNDTDRSRSTRPTGGAIGTDHGTITIMTCEFYANAAGQGGAIGTTDATIDMNSSHLEANRGNDGGAIFAGDSLVTIENRYFMQNSVVGQGGAVKSDSVDETATVANSVLPIIKPVSRVAHSTV